MKHRLGQLNVAKVPGALVLAALDFFVEKKKYKKRRKKKGTQQEQ